MSWLRAGDNGATHPAVMALVAVRGAEPSTLNEVAGFVLRCAMQSAGHRTDGRIDLGTATLMGNGRHDVLLTQAEEAGLLTRHGRGKSQWWQLINDPDFLHIRSRAEQDWERERKRDIANPDLVGPVKLRDGDGCRYCGVVVNWAQRRGNRRGTYHHLDPGTPAKSPDDLVVACFKCNSEISDLPRPKQPTPAAPPRVPLYGEATLDYLRSKNFPLPETWRPVTQADTAARPHTRRPAPQADNAPTEPTTAPRDTARRATPTEHRDHAPSATPEEEFLLAPAETSRNEVSGPGRVGSGRAGTARDGEGVQPTLTPAPALPPDLTYPLPDTQTPRRRRARRGRSR